VKHPVAIDCSSHSIMLHRSCSWQCYFFASSHHVLCFLSCHYCLCHRKTFKE